MCRILQRSRNHCVIFQLLEYTELDDAGRGEGVYIHGVHIYVFMYTNMASYMNHTYMLQRCIYVYVHASNHVLESPNHLFVYNMYISIYT